MYNEIDQPLTGNNIRSNLRIALCEGVENPAAASIESLMRQVVEIRQRAEAVDPEPEPLKLGPVEAGVRLHPAGRGEAQDHKDEHEEAHTQRPFPGCGPFPVQLCIREDVVFQAHPWTFLAAFGGDYRKQVVGRLHQAGCGETATAGGWDNHKQVVRRLSQQVVGLPQEGYERLPQ